MDLLALRQGGRYGAGVAFGNGIHRVASGGSGGGGAEIRKQHINGVWVWVRVWWCTVRVVVRGAGVCLCSAALREHFF